MKRSFSSSELGLSLIHGSVSYTIERLMLAEDKFLEVIGGFTTGKLSSLLRIAVPARENNQGLLCKLAVDFLSMVSNTYMLCSLEVGDKSNNVRVV